MSLLVHKADAFVVDVATQFAWYVQHAGEVVAWRFFESVNATLSALAEHPAKGRRRQFQHKALRELRSFPVREPFDRFLIFYRATPDKLEVWRLMHGARDLPRRLSE